MELQFRRHFVLQPKMKNVFLVQKRLGLGLEMQSIGLGLEH